MIEDDDAIRAAVQRGLRQRGYAVASVSTGLAGLEHVLHESPQVVVLDLGLPDVDGIALISMIRAASAVPIIVITAQDDDPTMIRALDSGADDYVVKPFGTDQVAARVRAVLRRTGRESEPAPWREATGLVQSAQWLTAQEAQELKDEEKRELDEWLESS